MGRNWPHPCLGSNRVASPWGPSSCPVQPPEHAWTRRAHSLGLRTPGHPRGPASLAPTTLRGSSPGPRPCGAWPRAPPLAGPRDHPPGSAPATTFPGAAGSTKPALDWLMREGGELPEADEWTGGDTPALSTSSLLSGDGDSAEHEGPPAPLILLSSLDYQYDTPGLGELVRPGPGRGPQGRGWGPIL